MTEFADKTLVCRDCGKEFVFTVGEQEFYKDKGFENDPVRCPECRSARKHAKSKGKKSFEPLIEVTCDSCKTVTKVPFKPTQGKPVYCRDCYEKMRNSGN